MFDIGNNETEDNINYFFSLKRASEVKGYNEMVDLNKAKSFLIIGLLQDYWKIVYPDNKKIKGGFRGAIHPKSTYFF